MVKYGSDKINKKRKGIHKEEPQIQEIPEKEEITLKLHTNQLLMNRETFRSNNPPLKEKKLPIGTTIETEWINFELLKYKLKTQVWSVDSKCDDFSLGIIEWYPQWRHYCFFPIGNTVLSDRCLIEIRNFVKELNDNHGK